MKTKLYIVRHAETLGNAEKRLTGIKDYELSKKGLQSIEELTEKLKNIKFDKIYTSESQRTVKTITPLALLNKLEIEKIKELDEMDFGVYDGWKWEEINKKDPKIKETQNQINEISGIPGQETMEQVANRMYNCIEMIANQNIGKTVLICSHGVAIEAFLRKIANIPFKEQRERFCQHNVDINEIDYENGKFYMIQLARQDFL